MLNKYPYTSGHILVIPNRHTGDYQSLTNNELHEMASLTREFTDILKKTFNPQGFNIGMNIGRFAGAGIEDHLHTHIVPRWSGDNNFMPVIAEVKIHPIDLDRVYELIMEVI
jgi:ATP adenylyltransferase